MKINPHSRFVAVYHPALRLLHWLMAALIFIALGLGLTAKELPRGSLRSDILFAHKSIGLTILMLAVVRVVTRLSVGAPPYAVPLGKLTQAAANAGHLALYALMFAMPISGYILSGASGADVPWFGVFHAPIVVPLDDSLAQAGKRAHFIFAWTIAFVLAAHLAAVVWHARFKRDTVLTRMWPSFRPRSMA